MSIFIIYSRYKSDACDNVYEWELELLCWLIEITCSGGGATDLLSYLIRVPLHVLYWGHSLYVMSLAAHTQ